MAYEKMLDAPRHLRPRSGRPCVDNLLFVCRISIDDHLTIESSKRNTSNGQHRDIGKSGRVRQSSVRALGRPRVRDGDDTGDALASRERGHVAPHLHDLRDRSCRSQYRSGCVRAGFGDGRFGYSGCRSFPDLPPGYYPVYSSSSCICALIARSV